MLFRSDGFLFPATYLCRRGSSPRNIAPHRANPAWRRFYCSMSSPSPRPLAICEAHSSIQPHSACRQVKTKKAAGEFLRPVRAQIANAADSRPPVRHFWLCIQLTIILTTMPAIIGAARSSHKIRPNCVSVIEPPVLQWQPFAAIFNLSGVVDSPRSVAWLTPATCEGFLFPATYLCRRGSSPRNIAPHRANPAWRRFYCSVSSPSPRPLAICEAHSSHLPPKSSRDNPPPITPALSPDSHPDQRQSRPPVGRRNP